MTDPRAILAIVDAWAVQPPARRTRFAELADEARGKETEWIDAILTLVPDELTDNIPPVVTDALEAILFGAEDGDALAEHLAIRARERPTMACAVARPLMAHPWSGRALEVLGEDLVFDTWTRYQRRFRMIDGSNQHEDAAVDWWAVELFMSIEPGNPELMWGVLLRYLAHEPSEDAWCHAGIAWLESINFDHAADFIDRIEAEARSNARLRRAMRGMYPPQDEELARRFVAAAQEPAAPGKAAEGGTP